MFSENPYLGSIFLVHFQPIIVLTGPMLYFYVRGVLADDHRLRKNDWIHFIPSVLYFINCSSYYIKPFSEKLAFAQHVISNRNVMLFFDPVLFSGYISYIGRSLIAIAYTTICVIMLYRHYKEDLRSHFQNVLMFRWLTILLSFNYVMNIGIFYYVIQLLYHWKFFNGLTVVPWSSFLFGLSALIAINLVLFFFPNILYGLPRMDYYFIKRDYPIVKGDAGSERELQKPVRDFEISNEKLELIGLKIAEYSKTQPYLSAAFNIRIMSSDTEIPVHHLSYYFNVFEGKNFNTWKNNLRIEYVIQLLKEGSTETLTLQAISKQAGFISRNTFNIAFKDFTGYTPSEYLLINS